MRLFFVLLPALALLVPTASAQGVDLGIDFTFDQLRFTFHPNGPEASGDEGGSSLDIFADRVKVEGDKALDLRHCIDGQDDCSYSGALKLVGYAGDKNGEVEATELQNFQQLAPLGVEQEPKIVALNGLIRHNISVDGKEGGRPHVTEVTFEGVLGPANSTATVDAFITIEVEYNNDKKAKSHTIEVRDIDLTAQGYAYGNAVWVDQAVKNWQWNAKKTEPASVRGFVTADGWTSTQTQFEESTLGPLKLVVEQKSGKRAPGFEAGALVASLAGLWAWAGRRSQ